MIIVLPCCCNKGTATCIGYSAARLLKRDNDAVMMVLPSDHYVGDEKVFEDTLKEAVEIVEKKRVLVTIGIKPTRVETGYGYIQMGEKLNNMDSTYKVGRFVEKPNIEVARDFLLDGNYLWNSGMFIWRADALYTKI